MWLMVVPGVVAVVTGGLLLWAPGRILRERDPAIRALFWTDTAVLRHRVASALCLLVSGGFCLFSAYYVWYKVGGWSIRW